MSGSDGHHRHFGIHLGPPNGALEAHCAQAQGGLGQPISILLDWMWTCATTQVNTSTKMG
jgi:hypothetical protein